MFTFHILIDESVQNKLLFNYIASYALVALTIGVTVFSDIREDYYNLYSSASKHIGDTRVILATPSDDVETVFLQRTAVTYR